MYKNRRQEKIIICNNVSQYCCFYTIINQVNVALMGIRNFLDQIFLNVKLLK